MPKAHNIALCDKVSLTVNPVNPPYDRWEEIQALSMGTRRASSTAKKIVKVGCLMKKYPQGTGFGPQKELSE